jgi:ERCC4-type nuclease
MSKYTICIDGREKKLISICKSQEIQLTIEGLDIGDIIIRENGLDKIIIERKSIPDLVASIKDGRYTEQMVRLTSACDHPNHNIFYIIEGKYVTNAWLKVSESDKKLVESTMISLSYYHGFSVVRTQCMYETVDFLQAFVKKLSRDPNRKPFYINNFNNLITNKEENDKNINEKEEHVINDNNAEENILDESADKIVDNIVSCDPPSISPAYCEIIKRKKSDNITANNIGRIMIQQIPGVSPAVSGAIFGEGKYTSIHSLVCDIHENPGCLNGLTFINNNGKTQKINSTTIQKIIHFLRPQN